MFNWKAVERVLGETIRDIGVLILVFAPLDAVFAPGVVGSDDLIAMVAVAVGLIVAGIILQTEE